MIKAQAVLYLILALFITGCASTRVYDEKIASLTEQLDSLSGRFELAKQENQSLNKELLLFKKDQNVDTQRFIEAQDAFENDFSLDIRDGDVWVRMTDRGLIITIDAEKLFISASDALSDSGRQFFDKISGFIGQRFASNYIYIEGHTDNQSLAVFEWKSDWEFSFARALNVLKYLTEKKGVDPLRLSASGFGQYRPRAANDTKEGRKLNRRIEVIISPQKIGDSAKHKNK